MFHKPDLRLAMFSGECWTWLLVVPVITVLAEPYPINVVVLLETGNSTFSFSYLQARNAVGYAEKEITFAYSDIANFTFIYRNTSCNGEGTAALVAKLQCDLTIGVFIGPACPDALDALLPLAKSWNIPVITPVGSGISDSSLSQMVTKLSPYSVWSYVQALVAILTKYEWYKLAIVFDESSTESETFTDGLISVLEKSTLFEFRSHSFKASISTSDTFRTLLVDASAQARVFILSCDYKESRALMLQAYHLGYATSGEYVFFIVDELSKVPGPDYWQIGQPDEQVLLEAMGHVIWPYVDIHWPISDDLSQVVTEGSLGDHGSDGNGTELSPYLAGYYESAWVYVEALSDAVTSGRDPINGTAITLSMWNRTYKGIFGPIRLNNQGFRQNNVTFGFFQMKGGQLKSGAFYAIEMGMLENQTYKGFDWPYNHGDPPLNYPKCGFRNNLCQGSAPLSSTLIGTIAGLFGLAAVTGFLGAVFMYRGWKSKHNADLWWWKINSGELVMSARTEFSSMYLRHSKHSLRQGSTIDEISLTGRVGEVSIAMWKGQTLSLRRLPLKQMTITKAVLAEFRQLKDINHCNLVRVFGACFEESLKALVTECCNKGSLQDLLGNMNITLDAQFKSSICRDIIDGLCYIHQSPIHQHGRLNSNVCLIDNRFSVKLTDFGLPTLYSNLLLDVTSDEFKNECKWKAPEILRSGSTSTGTMEGDIYSYGMILVEVITQESPFATENAYMTNDEIIQKVQDSGDPPFRPAIELVAVTRSDLKDLIRSCWSENPKSRPSCQSVRSSVKRISASLGDTGNLMENLMRRMELYANNLEKMVEEKTVELREEKKKSEELLYQILPRSVADRLKSGLRVDPQVYDGVTIYFSDIVGFTEISAVSSPMEVVDLLNDIYSCFDAIIEEFDVYKVETIGDAYMVVSGLPQRNGNLHAVNIARMSIKVLETIREFKIRHMPTEGVRIRIGLHSGPVCAGVVGSKMPRYCLFGDTVNTASRMESSGKAMMIHISPSTKALLDQFGSFHVLPRGNIEVKGKGQMFTYWLQTSLDEPGDLLVD